MKKNQRGSFQLGFLFAVLGISLLLYRCSSENLSPPKVPGSSTPSQTLTSKATPTPTASTKVSPTPTTSSSVTPTPTPTVSSAVKISFATSIAPLLTSCSSCHPTSNGGNQNYSYAKNYSADTRFLNGHNGKTWTTAQKATIAKWISDGMQP